MIIRRNHHLPRKITNRSGLVISVIGGISSGKTLICKFLRKWGFYIFNADAEVHNLLKQDGAAFKKIIQLFPDSYVDGKIDKKLLSDVVFFDPSALHKLESVIHPEVQAKRQLLINQTLKNNSRSIVCEVPLLLESATQLKRSSKEIILLIKSPLDLRRDRALLRKGMTINKFEAIIERQISDEERELSADCILLNLGTILSVKKGLEKLTSERCKERFKKISGRYRNNRFKRQRWA